MSATDLFAGILPFVHTAEARSFRKAGERLGVTSAAVSKAVLRLEERLGVKLLARTSRSVALTPEGTAFLARCRDAIASVEAGHEQLSESRRAPHGEVHLTLPFILGRVIVPELGRLASRYPRLTYRLTMTDRLTRLVEEQVDVAIRIGALEDSSLVVRPLRVTRWVTVAAPGYLARRGVPGHPRDLARHDGLCFVAPSGRPRDWTFTEPGRGARLSAAPPPRLLINQGEHLLAAALAGLGLAQVLDFMVGDHVADGRLIEVLGELAAVGPPIQALVTPERSRAPNVRAVLDHLDDQLRRSDRLAPGQW